MDLRSVRLKNSRVSSDSHCFADFPKLQCDIHTAYVVQRDNDFLLFESLESGLANLQIVVPGREIGKIVSTCRIRGHLAAQIGPFVAPRDGALRNRRATLVLHIPYQRTIQHLALSLAWK